MPPPPPRCENSGMPTKLSLHAAHTAAKARPVTPEVEEEQKKVDWKEEHPHSFIARRLNAPKGHHDALEVDFDALLEAAEKDTGIGGHGDGATIGKYVKARRRLRRAQVAKWHDYTLADEENMLERADERYRDESVGLSTKTGAPTLSNPTRRQMELTRRGLELRRDKRAPDRQATEAEKSVYRSHVAGELVCVGEDLPTMPPEVANTLTMQFGLRRVYMPRNGLPYFENYEAGGHHFSARHMMHIEEIDMQHNHAFRRLPDDVGQLVKLQRLCLQHTAICNFPPSFLSLTNLKHLDLTHCAFKYLPDRFGTMANLEFLNLRNNMLIELPPTFFHLKGLRILDLSSNGMAYLAIKPHIGMEDPEVSAGWEERIDPASKKKYFHNLVTGVSQKAMPDCLKKVADVDPNSLFEGTRVYNEKKKSLAGQGIYEWEAVVDQTQGSIYYQNNVNGKTVWDMPESMDSFGRCFGIESFKMNDNLLRDLPESMSLLTDLRLFECKNNYLGKLPLGMGELTSLRVLRLPQNEIKWLPESMSSLAGLTELVLTSNHLSELPQWFGDMTGLRQLMLGNNRLERLPFKLGFCTDLAELQVYNNPMEDPPYETVLSGMRDMLWYLRQRFLEVKNGPKPAIAPHFYGINGEKVELAPVYQKRIEDIVEAARGTNELDLIQNGLSAMPNPVCCLPNLTRLNMTAQHMTGVGGQPIFTENLTNLTTLWLKRCELDGVDESMGLLRGLTELDLSENKITDIPRKALRHLKKLETINFMKNHLYELPDSIGNIGGLKTLIVDMNRLDLLPSTFQKLRNLEHFSAAMNNIYTLPDSIGKLGNLKYLGLEGNQLCRLPPGLGHLFLKELRVSHNRLERLELDLMAPNLQDSIETLLLSNNNLLELPAMFDGCGRLRLLQIDYNPMRSPPTDLLEEGMHVIIQYCRIRSERVKEVIELLEDYGFEIEPSHFTPTAREALTGNTGFLTPEDLDEFDAALDAFLNGKYYECPVTCADMVDKIDALRHERQYIMYNMMLQELLAVMRDEAMKDENIAPKKEFSANVLQTEVVRPWGRKGEDVFCYAATLDVLLRDTLPNDFVNNYRESLFEKMKARLPVTVFTYTPEILKDAINDFEGPYGKVCMIEKVEYEVDEYVDDNMRARRKNPCVLPSLVITRVVYTASEARRRQEEDEQYWAAFHEIEGQINDWLESKVGKKRLTQETRRRHRMVSKQVRKVEETKRQIDEENSMAKEELSNVKDRKRDFDEGKAFHEHQITSLMDALRLVDDAEKEVDVKGKKAKELNSEVAELHCKLRMKKNAQVKWATNDLKRKYCHMRWHEMLIRFRAEAMDREWRRPWDGVDGQEFEDYADRERLRGAGVTLPDEVMSVGSNANQSVDTADDASQATGATPTKELEDGEVEVKDEFDWEGCDKMEKFINDRYQAFLAETRPFALRNPWDKEEEEGEEEEEAEESLMDAILSAGDDVAKEEKAKREAEQLAKEQEAAGIVPRSGGTPSAGAKTGL